VRGQACALFCFAFIIGAILVISALAISPAIVTEKRSILPNRETRSLRVKARAFEDISVLDKAFENQLDRPSVVFINDGFIEHSRQSVNGGDKMCQRAA
jgi:hypothetical protein